ncbi:sensor domain-containing protein [Cellvibrio sp. OA-2007]|uniref:sensor domain-containing protein n=1 Tax=Cellvibrio sp. OA-2007 TaxID=529823 RepID=UPI000A04D705|nr:EAL domain-containing protein [Cellvibrio sp. OA-2007]
MERYLLRTLGDHMLDLIYAKDENGRFIYANLALVNMTGAESIENILGKTDFDLNPPAAAQAYVDDDQWVIRTGQPLVGREELLRDAKTGESHWYSTTKVPLRDNNGKIIGIMGISRDITQTKQTEIDVRDENTELELRVAQRTAELQAISATLEQERNLMRTLVDAVPDNIFVKDINSKFLLANEAVARGMGTRPENLIGKDDFDFFPQEMAQNFFEDEQTIVRTGEGLVNREELAVNKETGNMRWFLTTKLPVRNDKDETVALVGIGRDITLRRRAERALRESEARFRSLIELSSDWYWEQDADLQFIEFEDPNNKSSYQRDEVLGKGLKALPGTELLLESWIEYDDLVAERSPFRDLELRRVADNGNTYFISLTGLPAFDENGKFRGYRGIGRDITERKRSEEHIHYLATHDSLTSLPNRFMFSQILNLAIESSHRYQRKLAVFFIDLDRFKNINDTLGHEAGDCLLRQMATRLKQCLRASDVVGRLGGDEFVILLPEMENTEQIATVAKKILAASLNPIDINGQECRVTASIGISVYPDDGIGEQALMKNADIAMYRAKEEGKNNYQFYSPHIEARSLERLVLENNLRMALERNEFFLHYQAKRNLQTGEIAGVEALVRWQHPELGIISPAQFIPLAEETGLIVLIGRWVLKTACAQNVAWLQQGLPPLCMAVNLSVRQFFDENLINDVADALTESGMQPQLLEMEITEGMVMQDAERAIRILTAIKALGVRLAIDDFGVGYSSLAQIKRFPIDTLKVDSSFIRDIPQNREDRAITEAIIAMGRTLSLTVIAEGVETQEQEAFLRDHACDQSQGYYFSKPISPEDFVSFMKAQAASTNVYPLVDSKK